MLEEKTSNQHFFCGFQTSQASLFYEQFWRLWLCLPVVFLLSSTEITASLYFSHHSFLGSRLVHLLLWFWQKILEHLLHAFMRGTQPDVSCSWQEVKKAKFLLRSGAKRILSRQEVAYTLRILLGLLALSLYWSGSTQGILAVIFPL